MSPGGPVWEIGLSYRAARLQRLAESIPYNRFLGSLNVYNTGSREHMVKTNWYKDYSERECTHVVGTRAIFGLVFCATGTLANLILSNKIGWTDGYQKIPTSLHSNHVHSTLSRKIQEVIWAWAKVQLFWNSMYHALPRKKLRMVSCT
jgi:hypothetical protein